MRAIVQMVRQPWKSLSGLVLCALAAAILVIGGGQYYATTLTHANLDDRYDTLALPSEQYLYEQKGSSVTRFSSLPEEYQRWVAEVIRTRPDLVRGEAYAGGLSAYIPDMAPDNFSQHEEGVYQEGYSDGIPYRCAVLEVTLTGVGRLPYEGDIIRYSSGDSDEMEIRYSVSWFCTGTIDRAVGLEQGFASPEGKTIALMVRACDEDALEALQLEEGGRYLVYGMDYSDVRGKEKRELYWAFGENFAELLGTGLSEEGFDEKVDCFMTVCDYSSLASHAPDGNGEFIVSQENRNHYQRIPDPDGTTKIDLVPSEAYVPDYCVPTMAKLKGGAEDYLASEEGFLWRQALEEMEISNHGFPVLAVEKPGHQAAFAREQARIVEGRDFTEQERRDGSRVCILSQSLAEANGLKTGDIIDMRYYAYDYNIQAQRTNMLSTSFPSAAIYSRSAGFLTETEGYRIVGLYRQDNAWQNGMDPYGFTPNTIFVPKSSVSCEMMMRNSGVYYSMLLQNGKKEEFEQLQEEAGYPDLYICIDQGYSQIVSALEEYQSVSAGALWIGVAASGAVMALFLILFPLQQGRAVGLMNAIGARRRERIRYIFGSSACILVPGAVLGGICGGLAWKQVTARLMESVSVAIPLEANTMVMSAVFVAVFLVLALAALLAAALALTGEKGLKKRK